MVFAEGADSVRFWGDFGIQMRSDKECPFNGVTNYSRVWRKAAEKRGLECNTFLATTRCTSRIYQNVCVSVNIGVTRRRKD